MSNTDDSDGTHEYTRLSMNIQRGEGVDRRGDVSVEIQRERNPSNETETAIEIDGETFPAPVNDEAFAEFYHETSRAVKLLEKRLGLGDGE